MKSKLNLISKALFAFIYILFASCNEDEIGNNAIVKDIDGNIYHTVTIGTRTWMVENLKTIKFRDGSNIPNVTDNNDWTNHGDMNMGAYCDYNNMVSYSNTYGRLYNWHAVTDERNICPPGAKAEVIVFDGVTPVTPPRANAIYLDPRGPGSPVRVDAEIKSPGFHKIERKHPIVRWTALDDVNIARGHKLVPEANDKVIGASDQGPILVTGARGGFRFVALGFDVRESDLPLRVAWPLLLLNSINFFLEETAGYISSFRTGDVFRVPLVTEAPRAELTLPGDDGKPGKKELVPVFEGRAVYLGQNAGIYDLLASDAKPGADGAAAGKTAFAANLLDREESTLTAVPELVVDGKKATAVEGFTVGVRREIWIYLLIAAVILTAIEWATYHRRVTV